MSTMPTISGSEQPFLTETFPKHLSEHICVTVSVMSITFGKALIQCSAEWRNSNSSRNKPKQGLTVWGEHVQEGSKRRSAEMFLKDSSLQMGGGC